MFSRRRTETEDRKMSDAPDDLGIPMKPARPGGSGGSTNVAPLGRGGSSGGGSGPGPAVAPRIPDTPRPAPEPPPRSVESMTPPSPPRPAPLPPSPRRSEGDVRKLIVGREISLSGEINSCDTLVIEGSVEANLQNCHEVDLAETGLFKGSAVIDEIEVRGRFDGNLTVRKRLLIRSTGRVSGVIRYGQIEIEAGGQIAGDIQMQEADDFMPGARVAY